MEPLIFDLQIRFLRSRGATAGGEGRQGGSRLLACEAVWRACHLREAHKASWVATPEDAEGKVNYARQRTRSCRSRDRKKLVTESRELGFM